MLDVLTESLSWNTQLGRWFAHRKQGVLADDGAFFFSTSTDLVNWTDPRAFHPAELVFTHTCGEPDSKAYASLLDPRVRSATSASPGGRVDLLPQLNYQDCHMTLDRDLMRIPVEITMTP